jgi:pimeloyl-ACP methyl ester carboxylesterase
MKTPLAPAATLFLALLLTLLAGCSDDDNVLTITPPEPQPALRPVVFVHGQSGSAQQFQAQAMRFTRNGYPQELLFAFEYDTSQQENPIADLDAFVDAVLEETGESTVYAIGHSRGTSLWTTYLDDPDLGAAAKVEKYVNIDGRAQETLPGGVPTIGIWGEWNTAGSGFNRREDGSDAVIGPEPADNYYFGDQAHTEVATSAAAFAVMYEFLTGVPAQTTDIAGPATGSVAIAGRAVFFPENIGYAGVPLRVWEIDADSGQRVGESPAFTATIAENGDFGPFDLDVEKRYEFALLRSATEALPVDSVHHFYFEPFFYDDYFLRLQTSLPGGSIEAFIPGFEDSASLVVQRQKEFWGDQGAGSDQLFLNGLDILTDLIAPRALGEGSGNNLAVFAFDAGGDNVTDLDSGELFPFNILTFLTGADVFMPAAPGGSGTTEITLVHRGGAASELNVPNWPSSNNRVSIAFRDDL